MPKVKSKPLVETTESMVVDTPSVDTPSVESPPVDTPSVESRLMALEKEIQEMKSVKTKKEKEVVPKKPRAPTEYNKFMSTKMHELKEERGENFDRKTAFAEIAKMWKDKKETPSTE